MEKYFETTVVFKVIIEMKGGGTKEKKRREKYLVKGETPTFVEARTHEFLQTAVDDWEIEKIVESKIIEVF